METGFHAGELAVQQAAGVRAEAERLSRMLDPADLGDGAAGFLGVQRFVVLAGRDHHDRLWASPLTGPAGFLEVTSPTTVVVHTTPDAFDPLAAMPAGQDVGLVVMDLSRRRRFRVNGRLVGTGAALRIEAEQAYGNCPQFISQRELAPAAESEDPTSPPDDAGSSDDALSESDVRQISNADTLFLGTNHPSRGTDASHRGGPAGFVRVVDERHLWWPDYAGNNMFNSLGNLATDPTAALLFCDFTTGRTLHVSGTARLEHTAAGAPGDDGGTGRRIAFTIERVQVGAPLQVAASGSTAWPRNPSLTD